MIPQHFAQPTSKLIRLLFKVIIDIYQFSIYRKNRFYLYSRRLPSDLQDVDRDIFNEKPSKEDIIAVPESQGIYSQLLLLTVNYY